MDCMKNEVHLCYLAKRFGYHCAPPDQLFIMGDFIEKIRNQKQKRNVKTTTMHNNQAKYGKN